MTDKPKRQQYKRQTQRVKTEAGGYAMTEAEYNQKWFQRLMARTLVNANGCFVWQGPVSEKGYIMFDHRKWHCQAHRNVYRILVNENLVTQEFVCHTCDERRCWNPAHLWLGKPADNSLDMVKKGRCHEWSVTHCPKGHPYDEENTYWMAAKSGRPARNCKACARIRGRLKAGWPEHLAVSLPPTPKGQRPVNGKSVSHGQI